MRARYLQGVAPAQATIVVAHVPARKALVLTPMHHVVNKHCAHAMQGYTGTRNATLYAVFSTSSKAYAHIKANRMGLYACVVTL
jgi:hypothetical protein